jgi:ERCC4-type nuclease
MKIIIDEREVALYEKCMAVVQSGDLSAIQISKQVLPLGDILIRTDEDILVSIIERKSLSDLIASVKDGRYEEQSHRLSYNGECSLHQVIYVIEGILSALKTPQEKRLVYSCIASLNCFKGFSVLRSSSVQETAEMLVWMADKIGRTVHKLPIATNTSEVTTTITEQNYCTVVKKTKKDNITPDNIGEILLCQIPGISSTTAIAIMKHFGSFPRLMEEIKMNTKCLDNLTCESNGKTRKINKKCLENIFTYLGELREPTVP